ncbi:hypothetical protein BX616_010904 [Lobosporangium transversale]|uniref:Uncharacterized protein n=1 Tax=Lobosporangium transversale TaxID=64571 RepID=A0A1Y2G794_9FUNG|nr:hypothetical protein BCR41DRAFT_401613 [Lobosporangium transversale]KAF9910280.1 hypothetical protein BX616_010904 [Lobosporangium transversale]ORY99769.1 hypothetical protein BCR41DRAFT_401613 [Lobosporangium transversale]|eukprot:XP_021876003.1 hypothetical protein BCR41DRAFT_401613 [Lobosporangium transversale]
MTEPDSLLKGLARCLSSWFKGKQSSPIYSPQNQIKTESVSWTKHTVRGVYGIKRRFERKENVQSGDERDTTADDKKPKRAQRVTRSPPTILSKPIWGALDTYSSWLLTTQTAPKKWPSPLKRGANPRIFVCKATNIHTISNGRATKEEKAKREKTERTEKSDKAGK